MKYRLFGSTGLRVSEIALGTGTFGTAWGWGCTPAESGALFETYVAAGGNFFDCADGYQNGQAEKILGQLIARDRDNFIVASKFTTAAGEASVVKTGNSRKAMQTSIEASLKRLDTDYLDVYWVHMPDLLTATDEVLRGLQELVAQGKIRYFGMSDFPAWKVSRAVTAAQLQGTEAPAAVQIEFSLAERGAEHELIPMAHAFGLAALLWSPLGGGLLSGKYRNPDAKGRGTQGGGQFRRIDTASENRILAVLDRVAGETGATCAQVAIAWVRAMEPPGACFVPILGARTTGQLAENLEALRLELLPEQISALDKASKVPLGFPHTILRDPRMQSLHSGGHWESIVKPILPRP